MSLHTVYPERTALFIDGANLYAATRALGFDIDYKKLLELFRDKGRLVRAFYYTALFEDQEYSPIRPLVDWLDYNGYTMVTKPVREFADSQGRRKIKGNMDMELAIDMLQMAQHIDHAVLFSGDGDFQKLLEVVQRNGVRVTVVSSIRTSPPMIADTLRRQADEFIELDVLREQIARKFQERERFVSSESRHTATAVAAPESANNGETAEITPNKAVGSVEAEDRAGLAAILKA